ncbi:hypothetical protein ACOME3_005888 [Neoechinorhynchus agilis]
MDDSLGADLEILNRISLLSKVCSELENHLNLNDKDLADYLIHLVDQSETVTDFRNKLQENDAHLPESFTSNLFRLIRTMRTSGCDKKLKKLRSTPAVLSMPNDPEMRRMLDHDELVNVEKQKEVSPSKKRRSISYSPSMRHHRRRRRFRRSKSPSHDCGHRRRSRSVSRNHCRRSKDQHYEVTDPQLGEIYEGEVKKIMQFGCFVEIRDRRTYRCDGLVHISNLKRNKRVGSVKDVVSQGDRVRVKVISIAGGKIGLSIGEVDQNTGEDLCPRRGNGYRLLREDDQNQFESRNPDKPRSMRAIRGDYHASSDLHCESRKSTQISDYEKWEIHQMISANCIGKTELPYYDEETGLLPKEEYSDGEDMEIELVDEEPPFLKGYGRQSRHDMSPVKIVKNPDGSLQQAAMMQSALAKERRELKQASGNASGFRHNRGGRTAERDNRMFEDPCSDRNKITTQDNNSQLRGGFASSAIDSSNLSDWKKSLITDRMAYGQRTMRCFCSLR